MIVVCLALVALLALQQYTHHKERRELYTRIQHPHLAPSLNVDEVTPNYTRFDDDDDFHAAERERIGNHA